MKTFNSDNEYLIFLQRKFNDDNVSPNFRIPGKYNPIEAGKFISNIIESKSNLVEIQLRYPDVITSTRKLHNDYIN